MEGKGSKKVGEGGLGCYQPLVTKIPPYMVQNLYSERELSIKPLLEKKKTRPSKMEVYHRGLWEHKWLQMATWNDLNKWI